MIKSPSGGFSRKLAVAAVALLLVTLLPVIALEFAARAYVAIKHGVPGKTYGLWDSDAELGAIHHRNAYNSNAQTNNYGFRNTEDVLQPKPAGALRIITYGGSTTYCYNLLNGQTWPDRLEQRLRRDRNPKDQVLNAGAILWSVSHEFARARRDVPELRPDVAILYTGINETTNTKGLALQGIAIGDLVRQGRFGVPTTALDQGRWEKRNLAIVRLFDYYMVPVLRDLTLQAPVAAGQSNPESQAPLLKQTPPDPDTLRNFVVTLGNFIRYLQTQGTRPVYVVMAYSREVPGIASAIEYSREGAAVARALGVTVIDAQQVVDRYPGKHSDLFIETGVHWSAEGAQLLAEFIQQSLTN